MRIAITGADGFVGKHATCVFRERNHEVIELVGERTTAGVRHVDLRDRASVRAALEGSRATHVLHLAGASSVARSHENPGDAFAVNTLGTVNLLDTIHRVLPEARVVIVSSGEVYGGLDHPAREEDAPHPTSPYASSKLAAEIAARQFIASYALEIVIARPFNHLGPGQAAHFVVPSFARQIMDMKRRGEKCELHVGNLDAVRDFSHVLDVVDAYEALLERGAAGETYNIASGVGRSIRNLLDDLLLITGTNATIVVDRDRLRPTEIEAMIGCADKLRALGWKPKRTVRDALVAVIGSVTSEEAE